MLLNNKVLGAWHTATDDSERAVGGHQSVGWEMLSNIATTLRRASAMMGIAAAVGCAGQAHAVAYVGKWDPAFGSPYLQLGWKGSATFEIPDACLAFNGTVTNFSPCARANGGLRLLGAEVEFYNLADPGVILDTLTFTTPSVVLSMTVANNALSAVVGGFFLPEHSDLAIAGGNTDFWLGFVKNRSGNFAQLAFLQWGPCADDDDECHRKLLEQCLVDAGFSTINADANGGRPLLSFSLLQVPEPGSLALLLPALGMLAVFRRRKTSEA